jgi:hypothetical protein
MWRRAVLYIATNVIEEYTASKLEFLRNIWPIYQTTLRHNRQDRYDDNHGLRNSTFNKAVCKTL